jgi:K+-sensing histidine kinase KdpD
MADQIKGTEICPCCGRDTTDRADHFVKYTHDYCLELRTPLNSMLGFADVLLGGQDGPMTHLQRQDVETIYHTGQHVLTLINDLIDLAKLASGEMQLEFEKIPLSALVGDVIAALQRHFTDKTIQVQDELPDMFTIQADRFRLWQILYHLLSLFLSYTGETIIVRYEPTADALRAHISFSGDWQEPAWRDNFEQLLAQTDLQPDQADLFVAKALINLHGGQIQTDTSAQSVALRLTLPVSPQGR